jgi:hypothetical protein
MQLLAQTENSFNLQPGGIAANVQGITVTQIVSAALLLILVVAAVLFFFMLVIGGVRWIASGGDKAQTEAARNQITAALIGLVIVFAAWAITNLIEIFFGINLFGNLGITPVNEFSTGG